jgi:hypothetical protein
MALTKLSEIARRYGVTRHAVQDWIRRGLLPGSMIVRVGGSVLIDDELLAARIRAGMVFKRPQRRMSAAVGHPELGEDSFTTTSGRRPDRTAHKWLDESGRVVNHPWPKPPSRRTLITTVRAVAAVLEDTAAAMPERAGLCRAISAELCKNVAGMLPLDNNAASLVSQASQS